MKPRGIHPGPSTLVEESSYLHAERRRVGGVIQGTRSHCRYELDGDEWVQIGNDIPGETAGDRFGSAIALSDDGRTGLCGNQRFEATFTSSLSDAV